VYCYASSYIPRFSFCRPKKGLVLRLEKEAVRLKGEIISIANSSDPYPNMEEETGLMRKCLEILSRSRCRIQIITKSNLVTRDTDLLSKIPSMVSITIITEDDKMGRVLEPHAPLPSKRLKAIRELIESGVPASVRIDPVIPFVNDNPSHLIKTLASLGVQHVTCSTYKAKVDNWQRFKKVIPEIAERLEPFYFGKGERIAGYACLPKELRLSLVQKVRDIAAEYGMRFGSCREGLSNLNTAQCDGSWLISRERKINRNDRRKA
jgi:DNA repair photolyase